MGSDIHPESRVGHGSRFWFDIDTPLDEVKPEAAAFADQLILLAKGYQSKALLNLVQHHIEADRIDAKG